MDSTTRVIPEGADRFAIPALVAYTTMFADARTTTFATVVVLPAVGADLAASTVTTVIAPPVVRADTHTTTLATPGALATVKTLVKLC